MDDVGRLVLFEDSLGRLHVPQVAILAAEEDVLLVLLGLEDEKAEKKKERNREKNKKKQKKHGKKKVRNKFLLLSLLSPIYLPTAGGVGCWG